MPELPEVETIARQLRRAMVGQRVARAELLRPDMLHGEAQEMHRRLPGSRILEVARRAKRLIITLHPELLLIFHLGMSGRVVISSAEEPLAKHTHLRIAFGKKKKELRFVDPRRFGGIWFTTRGKPLSGRGMGELGPEPLEISLRDFRLILQRRTQIKALLMDQRRIAGLGNIYCCEAMYRAGIHPQASANTLNASQTKRLLHEIRSVLREAIAHEGSTYMDYRNASGEPGSFQQFHRVYQREGMPCLRCKSLVQRITNSGRSTFLCPTCQPNS